MADDPQHPQTPLPDPIVVQEGGETKVFSPSPTPGEPSPRRRQEDTATYHVEWISLLVAILTWGTSFLGEVATFETWAELQKPKVIGLHLGQLLGTVVAVIAAKRIK